MPRPKPHEPTSSRWDRRHAAALLFALIAASALILALWPATKPRPIARETAVAEEAAEPAPAPPSVVAPAPQAAQPPPDADPNLPVIDEVTVEKKEVCEGEDNMIRVRAHTTNGTDEFLDYVIDGKRGTSVPLRLLTEDGQIIGTHTVEVFGKNGALVTAPVPQFKVKPCRARYFTDVKAQVEPNTWGVYDFVATIGPFIGLMAPPKPPPPFVPVRFEWDFGDGEKATTNVATVSHSYEGREQKADFSYMNVSVKMYSELGDTDVARTSLALSNPAWESLAQKGIVSLLISLDPRFPEIDPNGRVVQHVRLRHTSPQSVTIEGAAVTRYYSRDMKSWEKPPEAVDVGALLGSTTIPPGKEGAEVTVVLDTSMDEDLFSATYRLAGKSAKGEPVMGSFSVMKPSPKPNEHDNTPVTDRVLLAKILETRKILHKQFVNDDEIAMLDHQGAFANLDVGPASDTPSAPALPPEPPSMGPTTKPVVAADTNSARPAGVDRAAATTANQGVTGAAPSYVKGPAPSGDPGSGPSEPLPSTKGLLR